MSEAPATGARYLTRRNLLVVIVVLAVALVVMLVALLLFLVPDEVEPPEPVGGLEFLQVLYGPGVGSRPFFDGPMGVAYGRDGEIYVADTGNHRVVVFDRDGRFVREFGGLGVAKPAATGVASWTPGRMNYPTDVAVDDDDGTVYVADFRNDQIQAFDAEGRFLRAFPDPNKRVGKGASGLDGKGIAVTSIDVFDGRVYATDRYQVLVFDTQGELLGQFGKPGTGLTDLDHPNGIAVGGEADVLAVADSNNNRVSGLTLQGAHVWSVGEPFGVTTAQSTESPFDIPRGIAAMPDGSFMVTDATRSRLVQLTPDGEVLARYGQSGVSLGELYFPVDVDVDGDGERVAIAEKGADRVQVMVLDEGE